MYDEYIREMTNFNNSWHFYSQFSIKPPDYSLNQYDSPFSALHAWQFNNNFLYIVCSHSKTIAIVIPDDSLEDPMFKMH